MSREKQYQGKILVLEDHPGRRALYAHGLAVAGFQVKALAWAADVRPPATEDFHLLLASLAGTLRESQIKRLKTLAQKRAVMICASEAYKAEDLVGVDLRGYFIREETHLSHLLQAVAAVFSE